VKSAIRVPLVLLALAVLLVPMAAGDQGQITISRFSHVTVLTLSLHRGDVVDYSWSGNSSVTFWIENATGGNTFVNVAGQTGSGSWQATADGTYTFNLRNSMDVAATVQWNVTQQPVLAASYIYLIVAAAVALVTISAFYILRKKPVN
jgi:hypothetical protein